MTTTNTKLEVETRSDLIHYEGQPSVLTFYAEPTMETITSLGLRGCPLGRSEEGEEDAIRDLLARINGESRRNFSRADVTVARSRLASPEF